MSNLKLSQPSVTLDGSVTLTGNMSLPHTIETVSKFLQNVPSLTYVSYYLAIYKVNNKD